MQAKIAFRPLLSSDYDRVLALWRRSNGVEVAEGDDRQSLGRYLERNPGLSPVAESGGAIIAALNGPAIWT
jgi:hypothetical protein